MSANIVEEVKFGQGKTSTAKEVKNGVKCPMKSNKVFKFGDNSVLKSKGKYMIQITIAGKSWIKEVGVVNLD